jgi:hypothetical protein
MTAPGEAIRGGGKGGGGGWVGASGWVAMGWVAAMELLLSVGSTSIGVSLFCIAGITGAVGGFSGCNGAFSNGWELSDWTGALKAGSNGAPAMALATAFLALSTGWASVFGWTACPWEKLPWVTSGSFVTGLLPNSELVELLALFKGSIGTKS